MEADPRRGGVPRALLVGGAAAWAASQFLELVQYGDGDEERVELFEPMAITEEILGW